jgi:aminoglycoside phosphotransferase (APT) family kinase protein
MTAARRLPVDPVLPQLPALFDLEAIGRIAARQFGAGAPPALGDCQIERVKYRPRRNCVVGYRVRLERSGRAASRWERFSVAMYPGNESRERFERVSFRDVETRAEGGLAPPPVSWAPSLGAVVWPFPRDRKLPSLPQLCDPDVVRERWLPGLAAQRFGESWRVLAARTQVVTYFPEHGCTVRSKLRLGDRESPLQRVWIVYGQTRYDDAGERAFGVMRSLQALAGAADAPAGFARPLAYDAAQRILWQEGIPEPTLDRVLQAGAAASPPWSRVARAIGALHAAPLGLAPRLTLPLVLQELERARLAVEHACPLEAPQTDRLVRALLSRVGDLDPAPRATLHGDLHSNNVLVGGDRAWLIDLDRVSAGLPVAELGSLLGELAFRESLAGREPDLAALDALAAEYRACVPWPVTRDEVRWHLAAALLRERAWRCITSLKPGRLESLPRLLTTAARALECA